MSHAYGWNAQRRDHRDHIYNLTAPIKQAHQLPVVSTIGTSQQPGIWNQLNIGSCTAHGSLRAYLIEAMKQGISTPMLSRLQQYFDARLVEGQTGSDSGAQVRDAIKVLAVYGCAPEDLWPYETAKFADKPPASVYEAAKKYMAIRYQSIVIGGPGAPMRTAISGGNAICFGFPVPSAFEDGSWDPSSGAPLSLPGISTGFIGGHCVSATGYVFRGPTVSTPSTFSRFRPYFTCANSWDTTWGMGGFFNIDAEYFTPQRGLASDLWIIQAVV